MKKPLTFPQKKNTFSKDQDWVTCEVFNENCIENECKFFYLCRKYGTSTAIDQGGANHTQLRALSDLLSSGSLLSANELAC